jgi:tyrosine-protein phosphatase SIW14
MKKMNLQLIFFIAIAVLVVIFITTVAWRHAYPLPRNFAVVEPGVLYRSGQGSGYQLRNAIQTYHLKSIICLRRIGKKGEPAWFRKEKSTAQKMGVKFVHHPMVANQLSKDQFWIDLLKLTQDPASRPVLIHCAMGELRTGFFCAIYRMVIDGWSVEKAIEEMEKYGYALADHETAVAALKQVNVPEAREKLKRAVGSNSDPK